MNTWIPDATALAFRRAKSDFLSVSKNAEICFFYRFEMTRSEWLRPKSKSEIWKQPRVARAA